MSKRNSKRMQHGQAMVEFALTSLLFILVVVSVIELARIMHAYVTIQHAARVGGRYAVTGQWMPEFATSPSAHYNPDSGDPYARIYPCWPRFSDDPMPKAQTPDGPDYYEPYRGPRTCSVEKQVLQQMRPLALVPDAGFYEPGHYEVVVSSPSADSTPTTGQFTRYKPDGTKDTRDYDFYYENQLPTAEMVRGYAGKPNGQVIIQIRYNIRLITPLLSNIVGYIPLQARVVMTNEAFGSTSVLTEAAPAPNMGPVGPLHMPIPADLKFVVEKIKNTSGHTNPNQSDSLTYDVTVTNSGELNATDPFDVCLYASQSDDLTEQNFDTPSELNAMTRLNCQPVSKLEAGMDATVQMTAQGWKDVGTWYVYAIVDPVTTTGEIEGSVDEKGTNPQFPEQEKNNWHLVEEIEVGKGVKLSIVVSVPPTDGSDLPKYSADDSFTITVIVRNDSKHEVNNLSVSLPLPPELELVPADNGYAAPYWSNVTVPANGVPVSLTVNVRVSSTYVTSTTDVILTAEIRRDILPTVYYQIGNNLPVSDTQDVKLKAK